MNIYKIPILKRLIPSLIRRYKILFNPIIKNFEIDNLKIDLDIRESLERKICFEKKYEEERLIYLIQKIKTHQLNIFIDVGANIGLYSLRVAKNIPNINQVISFEPLLETFNKLKKNIIKNNLEKKIDIYNYGLSAQSKKLFGLLRKEGSLKHAAGFNIHEEGKIKLTVKKFDDIYKFDKQKIAIKCDIEGHELEAFKGMSELLSNNSCFLQIEIWEQNLDELSNYLEKKGYKFVKKIIGEYYFQNF